MLAINSMNCSRCRKKFNRKANSNQLCPSCRYKIIDKSLRRNLRESNLINKGSRILVVDKNTKSFIEKTLRLDYCMIYKPLKFFGTTCLDESFFSNKILMNFINKNKISCAIIPWTGDHEIISFLKQIGRAKIQYGKKINRRDKIDKRYLLLYQNFNLEDIQFFFKDNNLNFYLSKKDMTLLKCFKDFFRQYPDSLKSFIKGLAELRKALN